MMLVYYRFPGQTEEERSFKALDMVAVPQRDDVVVLDAGNIHSVQGVAWQERRDGYGRDLWQPVLVLRP